MGNIVDYDAVVTVDVNAPIGAVWDAITKPELIKQYMHGANTQTDWVVGSRVTWSGEWNGKAYEDKGVVLVNEPIKKLSYTHWSPMGGSEDEPENYHTVTIELDDKNGSTTLTLTQSNNATQEAADSMAKNAWQPMMQELKKIVEQ